VANKTPADAGEPEVPATPDEGATPDAAPSAAPADGYFPADSGAEPAPVVVGEPEPAPVVASAPTPAPDVASPATPGPDSPSDDEGSSADEPADDEPTEDPPGDRLGADLPDPGTYTLVPDEDEAEELDGVPDESDTHDDDEAGEVFEDDRGAEPDQVEIADTAQLDEATAGARQAKSTRPVRKTASAAVTPAATEKAAAVRKNRPTRTRAEATAIQEPERTTPARFVSQSVQELKKVVWPTGGQLRQYFLVVLAFLLFMIAFISLLDVAFGPLMLKIFGG
jgi:preprotein translocase subunit SecE